MPRRGDIIPTACPECRRIRAGNSGGGYCSACARQRRRTDAGYPEHGDPVNLCYGCGSLFRPVYINTKRCSANCKGYLRRRGVSRRNAGAFACCEVCREWFWNASRRPRRTCRVCRHSWGRQVLRDRRRSARRMDRCLGRAADGFLRQFLSAPKRDWKEHYRENRAYYCAKARAQYLRKREYYIAKVAAWKRAHPEQTRAQARKAMFRQHYKGIPPDQAHTMAEAWALIRAIYRRTKKGATA